MPGVLDNRARIAALEEQVQHLRDQMEIVTSVLETHSAIRDGHLDMIKEDAARITALERANPGDPT